MTDVSRASDEQQRSSLERLIGALRRRTSETQLTLALEAFAATDAKFAAQLLRALIAHAEDSRSRLLGDLPSEMRCMAEVPLSGGRRVDLVFESEDGRTGVLVELKLDAEYGHLQLDDYLAAAAERGYERSAVAAVTKSPPWVGEEGVMSDPRWLGSVRWSTIYDSLSKLEHDELSEPWKAFLRVVKDQGDFGVVSFEPEDVRGWARYYAGSKVLSALMAELAIPALDVLRHELSISGRNDSSELLRPRRSPVRVWTDRIHVGFSVPAEAEEERLRAQFYASDNNVYFCVEARYPDARPYREGPAREHRLVELTDELDLQGFNAGHDWESYWSRWHELETLVDAGENPVESLLAWFQEDVCVLIQSGLFDLLQELAESEQRPPVPAHDEQ